MQAGCWKPLPSPPYKPFRFPGRRRPPLFDSLCSSTVEPAISTSPPGPSPAVSPQRRRDPSPGGQASPKGIKRPEAPIPTPAARKASPGRREERLARMPVGGPPASRGGREALGAPPPPCQPQSPPRLLGIRGPGGAAEPLPRSRFVVAIAAPPSAQARPAGLGPPGRQASRLKFKMEVDINGESRSILATLPLPVAEVGASGNVDSEKPRCSSTPCSPMRQTVSGYQILHMDSNYLVGFTTGEELLKLAQKCTVGEENKVEVVPTLRSKQLDSGLSRSSRVCKARSRYYQPYEIPAINGRRRRRMPSSGDKCTKPLPYEPYKAFHGPLPLCLFKGKRAHSKSLDYLNLDRMNIKEPADTEVLQYQLQHLTLRGDRMFARNNT